VTTFCRLCTWESYFTSNPVNIKMDKRSLVTSANSDDTVSGIGWQMRSDFRVVAVFFGQELGLSHVDLSRNILFKNAVII